MNNLQQHEKRILQSVGWSLLCSATDWQVQSSGEPQNRSESILMGIKVETGPFKSS